MKKQAKKKPGGNSSSGNQNRKDVPIDLQASVGAVPNDAPAKKSPGDKVRWSNSTDRGLTITFSAWPFTQPPQPIMIAAGAKSDWFTIYPQASSGRYGYTINPTINPPTGPPGSPGVIVED